MMLSIRKHFQLPATSVRLARAFFWPFAIVVGGATAILTLAATAAGLNPVTFAVGFLTDAVVALSPLATHLLAIWAIYTVLVLVWDARFYSLLPDASVNPAWRAFVSILLRHEIKPIIAMPRQRCQTAQYRLGRATPSTAWSPGTHPQIE